MLIQNICHSLDIKSAIYSQIHLGYFSEYLLVKRGTIQSARCKLCHETLSEHYHEILHCRVLIKVLDHFMPLVLSFHCRNLSDEELVLGTLTSTKSDWLRNFITFTVRFVQSVSWILAEFRQNKIVQLPHENCLNVCRQLQRKVRSRKHDV